MLHQILEQCEINDSRFGPGNTFLSAPTISSPTVAGGSTLTLTTSAGSGRVTLLNTATGSVVTLPAATGSGHVYRFIVSVLATANSHIVKVASTADSMMGYAFLRDDTSDNAVAFFCAADTDTITLNRTTTGSVVIGETIRVTDIATGKFGVECFLANTGTPQTPFSTTV